MDAARWLYWLTALVAAGLLGLVVVAPLVASSAGGRILQLFAEDVTVRRTSIASAIGLLVTARVFFRGNDQNRKRSRRPPQNCPGA
jgi:hypothetical protein